MLGQALPYTQLGCSACLPLALFGMLVFSRRCFGPASLKPPAQWHADTRRSVNALSVLQVRASVPMYILSRKIKAGGFKVVMSGEGADEIYGGYLFFHKAPSPQEFQQ